MSIARCNICGIPESEWKNGRCYACGYGHYCDMTRDMIIDQRIYIWSDKHGQLAEGKKVPRYIQQYAGVLEEKGS